MTRSAHPLLRTLLLLAVLCTIVVSGQAATDWPMLLGSQSLSGNTDGIAPLSFDLAWSRDLPDRIYQIMPSGQGLLCSLANGTLVYLDTSGETLWQRSLPAPVIRMPVLWRDRIYVLAGRNLICLSLRHGEILWSRASSGAHLFSVPAIGGDNMIFYGDRTGIVARQAATGRELWRNKDLMAWGAAAICLENRLLVQHRDYRAPGGTLACLSAATGDLLWQAPIDRDANIFPPLVLGDHVLQAAARRLDIFALDSGRLLGSRTFAAPLAGNPLVMDGRILAPLTDGRLLRLDPDTLATTGAFSHHRSQGNRLAAAARRLYLAGDDNILYELDGADGKTLRRLPLPGPAVTHLQPVLAGGLLYAALGSTLCCIGHPASPTNRETRPDPDLPLLVLHVLDSETRLPLTGPIQFSWPGPDGDWQTGNGLLEDGLLRLSPGFLPGHALNLEKKGYSFTNTLWPGSTMEHTVLLRRLRTEERLVLRSILFDTDSSGLLPPSRPVLATLVRFLKLNPERRLVIEGHTDATGDPAWNRTLSLRRAEVIREYLILNGIGAWRLGVTGHGADRPIGDNATEAGRRDNRRTEMRILE